MSRTSYDEIAYPTTIFAQATPDRLATMARLHGLSPAPIESARVLEIGGGDGTNLLTCAAAFPGMRGLSFDLAGTAVERGRILAQAAGIGNVAIEQIDILDAAAGAIEGEWDYIIAHGIYAWVPKIVQSALLRLIERGLAADGIAFISYNAKPGGHLRMAMREILLHHLRGMDGAEARLNAAKEFLTSFAAKDRSDEPLAIAMRAQAASMAERPASVLHHDELGECFDPQSLIEIAAAAAAHGLVWLGEAGPGRLADGFTGETDSAALDAAHEADYIEGRFFRQSLFVREGNRPQRRVSTKAIAALFATSSAYKEGERNYRMNDTHIEFEDAPLCEAMDRLIAHWPGRIRCDSLFEDEERLGALLRLFDSGLIELHASDAPCSRVAGERPILSPLVRAQLGLGWHSVSTLVHRNLKVPDPGAREFLMLLDGSRSLEELERELPRLVDDPEFTLDRALQMTVNGALLSA